MLASLAGGFLGWILKVVSSDWLQKALDALSKSSDGIAKLEQINSETSIALKKEETVQRRDFLLAKLQLQQAKMNQPVFWIIIAVMMGPPALIIWGVAIYNILWWQHGIWPQPWAIADFPASIKPWVEKSIDWLYDPVGAPGTVVGAAVASRLTGRR